MILQLLCIALLSHGSLGGKLPAEEKGLLENVLNLFATTEASAQSSGLDLGQLQQIIAVLENMLKGNLDPAQLVQLAGLASRQLPGERGLFDDLIGLIPTPTLTFDTTAAPVTTTTTAPTTTTTAAPTTTTTAAPTTTTTTASTTSTTTSTTTTATTTTTTTTPSTTISTTTTTTSTTTITTTIAITTDQSTTFGTSETTQAVSNNDLLKQIKELILKLFSILFKSQNLLQAFGRNINAEPEEKGLLDDVLGLFTTTTTTTTTTAAADPGTENILLQRIKSLLEKLLGVLSNPSNLIQAVGR